MGEQLLAVSGRTGRSGRWVRVMKGAVQGLTGRTEDLYRNQGDCSLLGSNSSAGGSRFKSCQDDEPHSDTHESRLRSVQAAGPSVCCSHEASNASSQR